MNRRTILAVAIGALAAAWLPQGPAAAHQVGVVLKSLQIQGAEPCIHVCQRC